MRYVTCGEIRCSALGFGCGSVMGRVGRRDSLRAMHAAWDAGVTLFDTARSYGYGEAEGLLGEFLQGKRELATVVTKFGILPQKPAAWKRWAKPVVRGVLDVLPGARGMVRSAVAGEMSAGHFDVATMWASLHESLRQLRTEYVDVLLMHMPPVSVLAQGDLLGALMDAVAEGKVRRVGVSTDDFKLLNVAVEQCAPMGAIQFPSSGIAVTGTVRFTWGNSGAFVMVNHPFGGAHSAMAAAKRVQTMVSDVSIEPSLREKLRDDPRKLTAEVAFWTTFEDNGAQAVVTSMLKPEHVRANVAAIATPRLDREDVESLRRLLAS